MLNYERNSWSIRHPVNNLKERLGKIRKKKGDERMFGRARKIHYTATRLRYHRLWLRIQNTSARIALVVKEKKKESPLLSWRSSIPKGLGALVFGVCRSSVYNQVPLFGGANEPASQPPMAHTYKRRRAAKNKKIKITESPQSCEKFSYLFGGMETIANIWITARHCTWT